MNRCLEKRLFRLHSQKRFILILYFDWLLGEIIDLELAKFGSTQRGRPLLVHNNYTYIRNGEFCGTINWRCSAYRRQKCKAKAITVKYNGGEYVKLSHSVHSHAPKDGSDPQWTSKQETVDFLRSDDVDDETMMTCFLNN